jgi:hypothetical protein
MALLNVFPITESITLSKVAMEINNFADYVLKTKAITLRKVVRRAMTFAECVARDLLVVLGQLCCGLEKRELRWLEGSFLDDFWGVNCKEDLNIKLDP